MAIVGGGPAGATVAARLARAGHEVVVLERASAWRWHACGVFSSPATVEALRRAGLDDATVRTVSRAVPAMRVETPAGTTFRLTYGDDDRLLAPAVGFDRSVLDPALLRLAEKAGAEVRRGAAVVAIALAHEGTPGRLTVRAGAAAGDETLGARVIVGADGLRSIVARAAGVARAAWIPARVGLTYHLADERPAERPVDARMRLIRDGYVGIAPVPGRRLNIGIVLGPSWGAALARDGAERVAGTIVAATPRSEDDPAHWRHGPPLERIAGAAPIGHRVARRTGPNWLLVGDAAGFLDPFTGEGLHRALVSAELASAAIDAHLRGRAGAFDAYERAMRRRFAAKDGLSLLVQAFLARPGLFEYAARRLRTRDRVRATMGLVMGDLIPAGRAFDPRFLVALLAP